MFTFTEYYLYTATRSGVKHTCFGTFHACPCHGSYFLARNMHETLLSCMNHDWFMRSKINWCKT